MQAFIIELSGTVFQWSMLAVIVGAVSLRYWQAGQPHRSERRQSFRATSDPGRRAPDDDMSWLSLSEPADGGVSQRDPLFALGLNVEGRRTRGRRLA